MKPNTLTHGVPVSGWLPGSDSVLSQVATRFKTSVQWFFDLYVFGNVHMALCAVALTLTTEAVFHLQFRNELLVFVFCGTLFGYNLQRLPSAFETAGNQPRGWRHQWNTRHRALLTAFSIVAAIGFTWSASQLYWRSQIVALVPAVLSFAYAFPLIPTRHKRIALRDIPGIKILVIAITWTCSCALLPIAAAHREGEPWISPAALLWALLCGMLVFSLTVPFDIRDLRFDEERLKTLPALLGVRKSILAAIAALMVSTAIPWISWRYLHTGSVSQAFAYSAWCVVASLFIYNSSPQRHEYYFSFAIDGLLLLLWGMVWAAEVL